ncbi:MAG: hypothetical protein A2X94_00315 [Bdellovibrionales bacterium GWB1_55_8]|nr:MAG: hypothetical protein A2X94_00315 [Bdellovibrionales bacterium GWB1_55_8]
MGVRFAPSPTGTFHLGNLRTAWVSHHLARELDLPWVLRFEDIDVPRVVAGAMENQLSDMKALGMVASGVRIQSESRARHWELFLRAIHEGQVYPCTCSRREVLKDLDAIASAPHQNISLYSGRCRNGSRSSVARHETVAWRFRSVDDPRGTLDFVVARTTSISEPTGLPDEEGYVPAYNWACAIDDLDGSYELIVRCIDLLPVAPQQHAIQKWMNPHARVPAIFHTALVVDDGGRRLEKRTRGVTLSELLDRGYSADALVARFRASFRPNLSREATEQITISELLGEPLIRPL